MKRELNREDLRHIVYGSSFFGGGGGGSMEEGEQLLAAMTEESGGDLKVEMITADEMEEKAVSTMVAALGSPVATKGRTFQEESVNAVLGMEAEARFEGKDLKYVHSGEQGGGNTLLPIYAAWKTGKPIIDTDGNGRAVPELNTGLAPIHGVPTSPVILASERGDTITGKTKDPLDSKACENIARYMCQAYDQGIGFAAWMMDREAIEKATAIGQMSLTVEVGRILVETGPDEVIGKLTECFEGKRKFNVIVSSGVIEDITIDSAGGFDTGVTVIRSDSGEVYRVTFQNENLFVEDEKGKTLVTVPNIISILDLDLEGEVRSLSNCETKVGQRVALTATQADKRWYDVPEGYTCWDDVMVSAGYCRAREEVDL